MNQQLEASLDALSAQWQNGICPGAQILIRQGGQVLYEKSFGYANLEHQIPITSESIFHVASISKQFTVLSILLPLFSLFVFKVRNEVSRSRRCR